MIISLILMIAIMLMILTHTNNNNKNIIDKNEYDEYNKSSST